MAVLTCDSAHCDVSIVLNGESVTGGSSEVHLEERNEIIVRFKREAGPTRSSLRIMVSDEGCLPMFYLWSMKRDQGTVRAVFSKRSDPDAQTPFPIFINDDDPKSVFLHVPEPGYVVKLRLNKTRGGFLGGVASTITSSGGRPGRNEIRIRYKTRQGQGRFHGVLVAPDGIRQISGRASKEDREIMIPVEFPEHWSPYSPEPRDPKLRQKLERVYDAVRRSLVKSDLNALRRIYEPPAQLRRIMEESPDEFMTSVRTMLKVGLPPRSRIKFLDVMDAGPDLAGYCFREPEGDDPTRVGITMIPFRKRKGQWVMSGQIEMSGFIMEEDHDEKRAVRDILDSFNLEP